MNNKGALVSGIAKSAMARRQAGFTVEQKIQLPKSGSTAETLVELITRRLEQPMPQDAVGSSLPQDLQTVLEACCTKFNEPNQTVLFRRGEAAFGMFLVLKGKVSLDFGVDGPNLLNTTYGPVALVGLPAALTGHNYSMTATVTEDAEVGFISRKTLQDLLHSRPEFRQQVFTILIEHEVGLA